ncbi:uncharacterized protein BDZ99DRAFT_464261 [Mytilinidion resinicola]|uniref:Uncharacterized protein n=1 Tax=Mytilinidion resinicola TaxID=574789 RepID=A0A6A6YHW8_9PEZI|nr:uncharacterized protein BDZ99DRAFT_464261 [Mytilinidion resinicola]KAF2808370.1 hypothetical protein BDZ99DRAFT_464261 [Mytilinidion resinicola]
MIHCFYPAFTALIPPGFGPWFSRFAVGAGFTIAWWTSLARFQGGKTPSNKLRVFSLASGL